MIEAILEILYPSTCIFCGRICKEGICERCRAENPYIREPRCKRCGKPISSEEEEFCHDCIKQKFCYEQGRSLWLHKNSVKQSVYAFKYKNHRIYGRVYAREMAIEFGELIRLWGIDIIVPVPLHKKKVRKRGFNQAEIIARELGKRIGIPVETSAVIREKYTSPQKELGQSGRRRNLRGAFRARGRSVKGKNILIIDDIYTTGSTINCISEELRRNGCEKTYFLTISIGQGF